MTLSRSARRSLTLDTSAILAMINTKDLQHTRVKTILLQHPQPYFISTGVLAEIAYLLETRYGFLAIDHRASAGEMVNGPMAPLSFPVPVFSHWHGTLPVLSRLPLRRVVEKGDREGQNFRRPELGKRPGRLTRIFFTG